MLIELVDINWTINFQGPTNQIYLLVYVIYNCVYYQDSLTCLVMKKLTFSMHVILALSGGLATARRCGSNRSLLGAKVRTGAGSDPTAHPHRNIE